MKLTTKMKGTLILFRIALNHHKSFAEVNHEMQKALDEAWAEAWTPGNIEAQVKWQRLFPGGNKPSVEEFITRLAKELES